MTLTELQWTTLRAVMDRIVPPDDFPGAWEAGVGDYLARLFLAELHPIVPTYQEGLTALEAESQARYSQAFPALSHEQQDELLRHISEGNVRADWSVAPVAFFRLLNHHVSEGYYSDPGNGGNRDGVAWKMTGFSSVRK